MRPLALTMRGFGAYAGEQRLDFRALGQDALFLVHGPTGSGKTTVLDGICFALYGETSGGERKGAQMRSDHADPATPTEVVFDFALGARAYRIRRNPDYLRAAARGTNMVREPPKVTLWRLGDENSGAERPEAEVLATKAGEVGDRVRDLLKLDARQFRQVVILPQGEFRRFLQADSREREAILAVLFGTAEIEVLQRMLKDEALAVRREIERRRERRAELLAQAEVESEAGLAERRTALADEQRALAERLEALRAEEQTARTRLERGRADAAKLAELAAAKAGMAAFAAREPDLRRDEDRLTGARRAADLEAERSRRDEAARRRAETAAELTEAECRGMDAALALTGAQAAWEAERAREADRAAAANEVERLRALAERLPRLFEARGRLDGAEGRRAEAARREGELRREREELDRRQQDDAEALRLAQDAAARVDGLAHAVRDLERAGETRANLARRERELAREEKARAGAEASLAEARRTLAERHAALERLEAAWRRGQAGALAGRLVEGEPCPVCGARRHPAPAPMSPDLPSEAALGDAREVLAGAEAERDRLQQQATERHGAVEALKATVVELRNALGPRAAAPEAALAEELARARAEHGAATRAAAALDGLRGRTEAGARRLRELAAGMEAAARALTAGEADAAAARAALEAAVEGLPEDLAGAATPEEAKGRLAAYEERARAAHRRLLERLQQAEGALTEARKQADAATGRLEAARRNAGDAEARALEAGRAFERRVVAAGFADIAAYEAARLEPEAVAALDAEIRRAREARSRAEGRLAQARAAAEGLTAPDPAALETAAKEAEAAVDAAVKRTATLAARAEQLGRWADALAGIGRDLEALDARYAVIGRVADVATGGGEGAAKINFQRFILGALLDEVLDAASQRLRVMSQNRYLLRRAAPGGDRRRATGLDLEVDDAYTGRARPLATLSGGEGFLVALALALGLADVAQARAGGVRLETLFVDEGFGSLDPEALDLALQALTDLRRAGRLVGVISHVPELRERIDVRLEVSKGRNGSTARFVLP